MGVVERIVEVINRAIAADPAAMRALFLHRVPCNRALADDPEVQVLVEQDGWSISALGLICGIAGAHPDGFARVRAAFEVRCEPCDAARDGRVGEACAACGALLELGPLLHVEVTPAETHGG